MARACITLKGALDLVQVLLTKIESIGLTGVAERNRIGGVDVPIFKVASNDNLRDTGH
jgi:hypothetical protein